MLLVPFAPRTLPRALQAGPDLLQAARASGAACFTASLVEGPAVLLGLHQRAARVVDVAEVARASVPVYRRRTAGTAAFVGGRALLFTLALPRVTALFPDATFRTVLNRNVRPFLKGLTASGALAHSFGREWVSSHRRPALLLGFDVGPDGAVLIEAIAGVDSPFSVPPSLASGDERSVDRFTGHFPAALAELLPAGKTPEAVAQNIAGAFAARAPTAITERPDLLPAGDPVDPGAYLVDVSLPDPVPPGSDLLPPAHVPIGWLERAVTPSGALWLGGDVLAPRSCLDRIAAAATGAADTDLYTADLPLDGVSLQDLLEKAHPRGAPSAA